MYIDNQCMRVYSASLEGHTGSDGAHCNIDQMRLYVYKCYLPPAGLGLPRSGGSAVTRRAISPLALIGLVGFCFWIVCSHTC